MKGLLNLIQKKPKQPDELTQIDKFEYSKVTDNLNQKELQFLAGQYRKYTKYLLAKFDKLSAAYSRLKAKAHPDQGPKTADLESILEQYKEKLDQQAKEKARQQQELLGVLLAKQSSYFGGVGFSNRLQSCGGKFVTALSQAFQEDLQVNKVGELQQLEESSLKSLQAYKQEIRILRQKLSREEQTRLQTSQIRHTSNQGSASLLDLLEDSSQPLGNGAGQMMPYKLGSSIQSQWKEQLSVKTKQLEQSRLQLVDSAAQSNQLIEQIQQLKQRAGQHRQKVERMQSEHERQVFSLRQIIEAYKQQLGQNSINLENEPLQWLQRQEQLVLKINSLQQQKACLIQDQNQAQLKNKALLSENLAKTSELQQQLQKSKIQLLSLEKECGLLKQQIISRDVSISILNEQIAGKNKQIQASQSIKAQLQTKINQLRNQSSRQELTQAELRRNMQALIVSRQQQKKDFESASRQTRQLLVKEKQLSTEVQILRENSANLMAERNLREELLERLAAEVESLKRELQLTQASLRKLGEEKQSLKALLGDLQTKFVIEARKALSFQEKATKLGKKVQEDERTIQTYFKRLSELESQKRILEEKKRKWQTQALQLRCKKNELEIKTSKETAQLKAQNQQLQDRARECKDQAQRAKTQLQQLKQKLPEQANAADQTLAQQNERLEESLRQLRARHQSLSREFAKFRDEKQVQVIDLTNEKVRRMADRSSRAFRLFRGEVESLLGAEGGGAETGADGAADKGDRAVRHVRVLPGGPVIRRQGRPRRACSVRRSPRRCSRCAA